MPSKIPPDYPKELFLLLFRPGWSLQTKSQGRRRAPIPAAADSSWHSPLPRMLIFIHAVQNKVRGQQSVHTLC